VIYYLFILFYGLSLVVLALFGLHKYFLLLTYKKHSKKKLITPNTPQIWPEVTVQLPIFNERYVVKRL
jgi:hypothetical protein